jgi:hypothetical protein
MVVKNLEFFDKDGYNLNLNWNETKHIWEGNIFFPRVSVGLYENTTIYVVEYVGQYVESDSDYTDDVYSYPMGEGNIAFQWDLANSFVDEFFMFDFDEDYEIKDTSSLIHTPYDGPVCETLIVNRFEKYLAPLLDSAQNIEQDDLLEVHVAFMADENTAETTYKRTLIMYYENGYTKYEIARITFFAETIEEDERLKIWNENLGYNLKPEDTIIFKHSDIHEPMPDYEILNEKRKELMLEGHNIYPYIGGYKAILNAIKFFGYDNLNIVEYWRNINEYDSEFGKIYRTYVYSLKDRKTFSTKRKPISLNTKNFQKLSNISLVYNINHPEENKETGKKYDEYGLPNVIEDFDKDKRDDFILTVEEALVKLFALRKKLNDEFMPGSTKITNIIGEGNYFGLNLIGNNPQISTVNYVESKGYVDFTVFPDKYCYLTENEDFAKYIAEKMDMHVDVSIGDVGDKTIAELEKLYDGSDSDSDASICEVDRRSLGSIISNILDNNIDGNNTICDSYEEYYNITYDNKFGDAKKYGLREIPAAVNIYKDIVLDDVPNDPYGENDVVPDMVVCAKAILKGNFSENINHTSIIEWKITHQEKGWVSTFSGNVKEFGSVFVQLPYLGSYDVEMSVWDVYNHCCRQHTKDAIIVKPYNIDIRGFYYDARPLPEGLKYDLMIPKEYRDDLEKEYRYYLWSKDESGVTKGIVTRKRNPMEMVLSDDIVGEYLIDGLGIDEYKGLNNLRDAINKERWLSIVNTESDGNDILKFAWLYGDVNESVLYGVDTYNFVEELVDVPFDENDAYSPEWNSDELYHVIKKNVDKMYSWALQEHLKKEYDNSTMRNYQPNGRVSFEGPYYKFDVDTILYRAEKGYKEYDHLNADIIDLKPGKHYEYVRYINSVVDIKPLTWVLLGFDYTRITGRLINNEYPKWTLIMLGDKLDPDENFKGDKIVNEHNGLYFSYLFEEEGSYKIKLELMDINGNKYEIEKFIAIVDKDANYGMYHTLKNEYDKYLKAKSERNLSYLS